MCLVCVRSRSRSSVRWRMGRISAPPTLPSAAGDAGHDAVRAEFICAVQAADSGNPSGGRPVFRTGYFGRAFRGLESALSLQKNLELYSRVEEIRR